VICQVETDSFEWPVQTPFCSADMCGTSRSFRRFRKRAFKFFLILCLPGAILIDVSRWAASRCPGLNNRAGRTFIVLTIAATCCYLLRVPILGARSSSSSSSSSAHSGQLDDTNLACVTIELKWCPDSMTNTAYNLMCALWFLTRLLCRMCAQVAMHASAFPIFTMFVIAVMNMCDE